MNPRLVTIASSLLLLAVTAAPGQAQASATDTAPTSINPQPLPPRWGTAPMQLAINPQPLPPRRGEAPLQQPWPAPYIGETEKHRG